MGEFQHWTKIAWLLLGLAIESPWLALVGHFSSPQMNSETVFWPRRASISDTEALLSVCRDDHWPRAMTIEESGSRIGIGWLQQHLCELEAKPM